MDNELVKSKDLPVMEESEIVYSKGKTTYDYLSLYVLRCHILLCLENVQFDNPNTK